MKPCARGFLAGLLLLAFAAPAVRGDDDEDFRLGTHAMRRILFDHKLTALNGWNERTEPRDTIVVLLGNNIDLNAIPGGLANFVERGGAVLIATDQPLTTRDLTRVCYHGVGDAFVTAWSPRQNPFVRPDAQQWTQRVAREAVYQEQLDCLLLQPADNVKPEVFQGHDDFGLSTGKLRVATNRSSFLTRVFGRMPARITPLAVLPQGAWYGDVYGNAPPPQPAAVHATYGDGELFLFADHTMFLNEMALRRDLGNLELMYNLVDQLQGTESPRSKVLFVHDGTVVTKLDVPIVELQIPLREVERRLTDAFNEAIERLGAAHQQDNRMNDEMMDAFEKVPWLTGTGGLYFLLTLVLGVALLCFLVMRLVRATNTTDLSLPLFLRAQAKVAPLPSLLEHRFEGMKQDNNFGAVARAVVRDWFAGLPGGGNATERAPKVAYDGGWWARWKIARLVRRLWRLAQGIEPRRVSQERFKTTLREMDELTRDLRRGTLRLTFA